MSELLSFVINDKSERKTTFLSVQDVEPVLDQNARLRNTPQKSEWSRHIASVPNIVCHRWMVEEHARGNLVRYLSPEWDQVVARKLNDPEWAYLRVDNSSNPFRIGWGK